MAGLPAPVPMGQYDANPDFYLHGQVQPRHGVNWGAHGRWAKVLGPFFPPGDARTHGWSRGLRIMRPEGWERRLRDRHERIAPFLATYVEEPDWFNYLTVPLVVPVTNLRGRTVTFTCRTYIPAPHGLRVRALHDAQPRLQEEVRHLRRDSHHIHEQRRRGRPTDAAQEPQRRIQVPSRGLPHHVRPPPRRVE